MNKTVKSEHGGGEDIEILDEFTYIGTGKHTKRSLVMKP